MQVQTTTLVWVFLMFFCSMSFIAFNFCSTNKPGLSWGWACVKGIEQNDGEELTSCLRFVRKKRKSKKEEKQVVLEKSVTGKLARTWGSFVHVGNKFLEPNKLLAYTWIQLNTWPPQQCAMRLVWQPLTSIEELDAALSDHLAITPEHGNPSEWPCYCYIYSPALPGTAMRFHYAV